MEIRQFTLTSKQKIEITREAKQRLFEEGLSSFVVIFKNPEKARMEFVNFCCDVEGVMLSLNTDDSNLVEDELKKDIDFVKKSNLEKKIPLVKDAINFIKIGHELDNLLEEEEK